MSAVFCFRQETHRDCSFTTSAIVCAFYIYKFNIVGMTVSVEKCINIDIKIEQPPSILQYKQLQFRLCFYTAETRLEKTWQHRKHVFRTNINVQEPLIQISLQRCIPMLNIEAQVDINICTFDYKNRFNS